MGLDQSSKNLRERSNTSFPAGTTRLHGTTFQHKKNIYTTHLDVTFVRIIPTFISSGQYPEERQCLWDLKFLRFLVRWRPNTVHQCRWSACSACAVPPKINRIELTETAYSTSDTITCSAEGLPTPKVAWTHISGSMPANRQFTGQGKAVLKNLKSGDHKWMCTASSAEGSDNYTLTFNGSFWLILTIRGLTLLALGFPNSGASSVKSTQRRKPPLKQLLSLSLSLSVLTAICQVNLDVGHACHHIDGWRFGVAVTRWSRSTQLLYIEPG